MEHVIWGFIAWLFYKGTLYRCLNGLYNRQSKYILFLILVTASVAGVLLSIKYRRNDISVGFDLTLGYGTYMILTYRKIMPRMIHVTSLMSGIVCGVCIVMILCRNFPEKKVAWQVIRRRLLKILYLIRDIAGAGMAVMLILGGFRIFFSSTILWPEVSVPLQGEIKYQTVQKHWKRLTLLDEDAWMYLSPQKKLDVLQTVANIEQNRLGLSNELNVGAANLSDDMLGFYKDSTHEIVISLETLLYSDAYDSLNTICHEAYHSWECRAAADSPGIKVRKDLRHVEEYRREFHHYIADAKHFKEYYNQKAEADARSYAKEESAYYVRKLRSYPVQFPEAKVIRIG